MPENENKQPGEQKYYRFQPGEKWFAEKDEVFTYRSNVTNLPFPHHDFEQFFKTILYGVQWNTFQDYENQIRDAITRETKNYNMIYATVRTLMYEWLDAMLGQFKQDMHNFDKID